MPTKSSGCLAKAIIPYCPAIPIVIPAARPVTPTEIPPPRCENAVRMWYPFALIESKITIEKTRP